MQEKINMSLGTYNIIDKELIDKSIKRVLESNIDYYNYVSSKGIKELREEIANFVNLDFENKISYKDILITTCGQQSISIVANSLLDKGDVILIENPSYFGAIDVFKSMDIKVIGVKLNSDGIDINDLEKKVYKYKPKMIYVIPTFNNPTGISWSNEIRNVFLKIINENNIIIVQDDPYSLINYTDYQYKNLYDLNNGNNVVYLSTFSKYISPSFSVGYVIAKKELLDILFVNKKRLELSTSSFIQYVILDYLKNNDLRELIKSKIPNYKKCLKESISFLEKKGIKYIAPKGGIFMMVETSEDIFGDSSIFYLDKKHKNNKRFNICSILEK